MSNAATATAAAAKKKQIDEQPLVKSLCLLDPLLQFLTKRSGKTSVPLSMLLAVLPGGQELPRNQSLLQHIPELVELGILRLYPPSNNQKKTGSSTTSADADADADDDNNSETITLLSWETASEIGFPSPPSQDDDWKGGAKHHRQQKTVTIQQAGSLCGSTKTAAKRRLAALKRSLKACLTQKGSDDGLQSSSSAATNAAAAAEEIGDGDKEHSHHSNSHDKKRPRLQKDWEFESQKATPVEHDFEEELCHEAKLARESLQKMFRFEKQSPKRTKNDPLPATKTSAIPQYILPKQAAYSGSHPAQTSTFSELPKETLEKIPSVILDAFGIVCSPAGGGQRKLSGRRLYNHQAKAISSAVQERHTLVCTSTGSGKSLVRQKDRTIYFLFISCLTQQP